MYDPKKQWEIRKNNGTVFAFKNDDQERFPIGKTKWILADDKTELYLKLQLDVDLRSKFCCDSGLCIDSELVCDDKSDCEDSSDERNCHTVILPPSFSYNSHKAPVRVKRERNFTRIEPLKVDLNLTITEVLRVNEVESEIDIMFFVEMTWYDPNLHFKYLKRRSNKNKLNTTISHQIWRPEIEFYIENESKDIGTDVLKVIRKSEPILVPYGQDPFKYSADHNVGLNSSEMYFEQLYKGENNPLKLRAEKRTVFQCKFDKINLYPFGDEICKFTLLVDRSSNDLTEIIPRHLKTKGRVHFLLVM